MVYNRNMEKITTAIIGGGAAGLMLSATLQKSMLGKGNAVLLERGERVGRKLSATGNGQGNVTNLAASQTDYFSSEDTGKSRAEEIVRTYNQKSLTEFFASLGVLLTADERGRVYPAGRQASALTDALRFFADSRGLDVRLKTEVTDIAKTQGGFLLTLSTETGTEKIFAETVVLCAGGKAAKNFGTDGSAYALAKKLGHTVTPLYPSLVQIKTDTVFIKTLKGIRVNGGGITAYAPKAGKISLQGDVIFTDYGLSGDAVFRLSAFIADEIPTGQVRVELDFLPGISREKVLEILQRKRKAFPELPATELLLGVVNNQVGRAILRRADGDAEKAASLVKAFPLNVTGSLGFDYAQVTKGGVPLSETDENLQSRFAEGLYFAGEILDVDGQCGGFNLQWAYSSARTVGKALYEKYAKNCKGRGQV